VHSYHGTHGPIWDGRFLSSVARDQETAMSWFKYILSHGVKEGCIARPEQLPGLNAATALMEGTDLHGLWLDQAAWARARRADPKAPMAPHLKPTRLRLTPIGDPARARETNLEVLRAIALEHAGLNPPGPEVMLKLKHTYIPAQVKRTRIPRFYAIGPDAKALLAEAHEAFAAGAEAVQAAIDTVTRCGGAGVTLPPGFQWPASLARPWPAPSAAGPTRPRRPDRASA